MRYCSKCGKKLADDQLYCPRCGNKEPFLKNEKQSSWKDFDTNKKPIKNVNYDFTVTKETKPVKVIPKNKGLDALGKTLRIFEIVIGLFFIVVTIATIIINRWPTNQIFAILSIVFGGINAVLVVILLVGSKVTKCYGPMHANAFLPAIIMGVFALGMCIGQYFLIKSIGFSPMGFVMGVMMFASTGLLAHVYSFKKMAK